MTISKQLSAGKTKSVAVLDINIGAGNIVPHRWHHEIKAADDNPDLIAITLLSELWVLYCKIGGFEFSDSYAYSECKFEFSIAQLQEATLRLYSAGLATRSLRTALVHGRKFPNKLDLQINLSKLLSLKAKHITGDDYNNEDGDIFHNQVLRNFTSNTSEKPFEHISHKERPLRKNKFTKFSLFKNSFPELARNKFDLASFYPLVQLDIALLQKASARNFITLEINKILLKLNNKHLEHRFQNKEAFISYMAKVLAHEMRDTAKISGDSFRIRTNETAEEIMDRKQGEFLSQIECSIQFSSKWHLRKKLCSVLERGKAYNFLSSYKYCCLEGNTFEVHLINHMELTSLDRDIILQQIKATHGLYDLANIIFVIVTSLKIIVSVADQAKFQPSFTKSQSTQTLEKGTKFPAGIWGSIRQALIACHGKGKEALDRTWFSRLVPEVNETAKRITLRASAKFFKDWVSSNYRKILEMFFNKNQYGYVIC
jgi:hypothetical protein